MLHTGNEITIVQVANCWMVTLPFDSEQIRQTKMFKEVAKVVRKEQQKDEILEQLDPSIYENEFNHSPLNPLHHRVPNVYLFKTYIEVVSFLASLDDEVYIEQNRA